MKRDYAKETAHRVAWIKDILAASGAQGLVFGSSGGKDSVLVGILCKMACENTVGVILPCDSAQNFGADKEDALMFAKQYDIEHLFVDLTPAKKSLVAAIDDELNAQPQINIAIAPRLRMTTLYTIAASRGALVVGTSNRSEAYLGYFTKWGDSACDLNPIADLTVSEVFEFLQHLDAPEIFYTKAPSAGLYEGQTDEDDLGFTYNELDNFLLHGTKGANCESIEKRHKTTEHKRAGIAKFN